MPDSNSNLLRSSRPVIEIDGRENARLGDGLLRLLVVETIAGLHRCEAVFGNWGTVSSRIGFLHFDRSDLDFGKPFRVRHEPETLFEGHITGLEACFPPDRPPEITVLAEDRLQDLRMTRRTRTFADVSDSAVFEEIARDHGLSADVDIQGPTHRVLAQVNQSDLAFLRDRARATGAEVWVNGTILRAASRTAKGGEPVELKYGRQLREFTVLADLAHQQTSLTAAGWDVSAKNGLTHEAGDDSLGSEASEGESGAETLRSAFGERKSSVVHAVPWTSDETRAIAESAFRLAARRFLCGRGVAQPEPKVRVGAQVDLQGLGPLFSGQYYITEARHRFDGKVGLRIEFCCERPWIGHP